MSPRLVTRWWRLWGVLALVLAATAVASAEEDTPVEFLSFDEFGEQLHLLSEEDHGTEEYTSDNNEEPDPPAYCMFLVDMEQDGRKTRRQRAFFDDGKHVRPFSLIRDALMEKNLLQFIQYYTVPGGDYDEIYPILVDMVTKPHANVSWVPPDRHGEALKRYTEEMFDMNDGENVFSDTPLAFGRWLLDMDSDTTIRQVALRLYWFARSYTEFLAHETFGTDFQKLYCTNGKPNKKV